MGQKWKLFLNTNLLLEPGRLELLSDFLKKLFIHKGNVLKKSKKEKERLMLRETAGKCRCVITPTRGGWQELGWVPSKAPCHYIRTHTLPWASLPCTVYPAHCASATHREVAVQTFLQAERQSLNTNRKTPQSSSLGGRSSSQGRVSYDSGLPFRLGPRSLLRGGCQGNFGDFDPRSRIPTLKHFSPVLFSLQEGLWKIRLICIRLRFWTTQWTSVTKTSSRLPNHWIHAGFTCHMTRYKNLSLAFSFKL